MEKRTKNIIVILIYLFGAVVASSILGTLFWNILSVAFLIAGVFGIISTIKFKEFLF